MSGADNNVLERLGVVNGVVQSSLKLGEREREGKKNEEREERREGVKRGRVVIQATPWRSCPY